MRPLPLLCLVVLLCGCVGETSVRRNPSAAGARFTYCLVETKYPAVEEELKDHASTHYQLITHEDARDRRVTADTMVLELKGDRGLQGSAAEITMRSLNSRRPLTTLIVQRGFFYGGMESALRKAIILLEPELAALSVKDHPSPAPTADNTGSP